jgi:hypothetical protein
MLDGLIKLVLALLAAFTSGGEHAKRKAAEADAKDALDTVERVNDATASLPDRDAALAVLRDRPIRQR